MVAGGRWVHLCAVRKSGWAHLGARAEWFNPEYTGALSESCCKMALSREQLDSASMSRVPSSDGNGWFKEQESEANA